MRLEDLCAISLGYPFRGRIPDAPGSGILVVQMKNVAADHPIPWARCESTRLEGKRKPDWLRAGDILFVARGSRNYATVVDTAIGDRLAVAAPHLYLLRCHSEQVLPHFLAWQLNRGPCQRYFAREAEGSLTKSIRRRVLAHTPVAVPPLDKQHKIVGLAASLYKKKTTLRALLRNGEQLMIGIAADLHQV